MRGRNDRVIRKGDEEMSDETYQINVVCENCDFKGKTNIPRGKLVKDAACPKFGNKTLREALPGEV
jgi:hypothetical protein